MGQKELLKLCGSPEMIKLTDINHKDEQFQTRRFESLRSSVQTAALRDSEKEVKALAKELEINTTNNQDKRKKHLKPIIIFRDPEPDATVPWLIVSGFHRYKAYLKFNETRTRKDQQKNVIPARVFGGTAEQAMVLSASMDIKPILPKHTEQKENAAWELIRTGNPAAAAMSVRALAEMTGVSKSEIQRMRKAFEELQQNKGNIHDSWMVQKWALKGKLEEFKERETVKQIDTLARQLVDQIQNLAKGDDDIVNGVVHALTKRLYPSAEPERLPGKDYSQAIEGLLDNLDF